MFHAERFIFILKLPKRYYNFDYDDVYEHIRYMTQSYKLLYT